MLERRSFLRMMGAVGASALARPSLRAQPKAEGPQPQLVSEISLDLNGIHKWDDSNGDTWDPFWADDDNLYAFNCDGRGFGKQGMNLAFNRLAGSTPTTLTGTQINQMDAYGKSTQKGPDNGTWKACGQECIDGVFYAFVSRNIYGSDSKDPLLRQLAVNSSLIKSHDRGRTWTRSAEENYARPMWPGGAFGAPFFIHYGRNGGDVANDGAREFVYMVSTNGFWNDGDKLLLARIRRNKLPDLNVADWEYFAGAHEGVPPRWTKQLESAVPILDRPAKCGQTPICYVPELGIYLLISWYNTAVMKKWFEPNQMRYDFYQALHPWGPWMPVDSFTDDFLGPGYHMYGPSLCARFQQRRGEDVELSLFTAGCPFEDVVDGPYKMWRIPVLLRTKPLPAPVPVSASDTRIAYSGSWYPLTTQATDASTLPRATQTNGSSAEFTFEGTGVEYVANKSLGEGSVAVTLDGVQQETVHLAVSDFPVLLDVVCFARYDLPHGKHVIRIASLGSERVNISGFTVRI